MQYTRKVKEYFSVEGYHKFYERYVELEKQNGKGEQIFFCPFHDDKTGKSATMNRATGLWNCFGSCKTGGDFLGFFSKVNGESPDDMDVEDVARRICYQFEILEEITDAIVTRMHDNLMSSPDLLEVCKIMTGLNGDSIARFRIGWAHGTNSHYNSTDRFSFPVSGADGRWEDVRLYNTTKKAKVLPWQSGSGGPRLFPIDVVKRHDNLIFLEGEKDTVRAHQCGIEEAFTTTAGAGQIDPDDIHYFAGKNVYVLLDDDDAGRKGAKNAVEKLSGVAKSVNVCRFPPGLLDSGADFSDMADKVGDANARQLMVQMVKASESMTSTRISDVMEKDEEVPVDVDFSTLSKMDVHGRRIRIKAHTVGASIGMKEYQIPLEVKAFCGRDQGKLCNTCRVMATPIDEMPLTIDINPAAEQSLSLVRVSASGKSNTLKRIVGIPERCASSMIIESRRTNVQTQLLSEPVEANKFSDSDSSHRMAYYHGPSMRDNADYVLTGYLQADPRGQESVLNIQHAEPVRSVLESFSVGDGTRESIQYFSVKQTEDVSSHMRWLYDVIEGATGIVSRVDIQRCVLFSIYSALQFKIGNKTVESGWIESLIVGDSRTGKSAMAKKVMEIVDVGEFIGCENVSAAGLIGGIQIIDNVMCPVWGKFPKNDRGYMTLDEMGELPQEIMSKLSSLRSSGRAEIQKIQQATTNARVRLSMIGNPAKGQTIAAFDCGVRAIPGVIRNMEDIARFTMATTVSSDDVDVDDILEDRPVFISEEVKSYFNDMAMLTWSLTPEQIVFSEAANQYVRSVVKTFCKKYHPSIPLVDKGSFMEKLARCCVPVAVLCGSVKVTEDNSAVLHVEEEHAKYAAKALQEIYDSKAMGYDRYSKQEYEKENLIDASIILQTLATHYTGNKIALVKFFLSNNSFSKNGLNDLMGFAPSAAAVWSCLVANNAIVSANKRDHCIKTTAFTRLLEQILRTYEADPSLARGVPTPPVTPPSMPVATKFRTGNSPDIELSVTAE